MAYLSKKSFHFLPFESIWKIEIIFIKSIFKITGKFFDNFFYFLIFIVHRNMNIFSHLCYILRVFGEFTRNYIRRIIFNSIKKFSNFLGKFSCKYKLKVFFLKIMDKFKKRKIRSQILGTQCASLINNYKILKFRKKNFDFIFGFEKTEIFHEKINMDCRKKIKKFESRDPKILKLWLNSLKFYFKNWILC